MDTNNESLTIQDLMQSLDKIKSSLQLSETEESWEFIFNGLESLQKLCQSGACDYVEELTVSIRSVHRNITSAMTSERTRLSGAAIDAINALALGLSTGFEPLISLFLPTLILLCGRANKVVVTRAKACILTIIGTTQLPGILLHLAHFVKDKTPTIRLMVAEGTLRCLKCLNPPDLEKEVYAREVENIIRSAARDANADVRKIGKEIFENYKVLLPHKVNGFTAPLTPTIRKYLQLGAKQIQAQGRAPTTMLPKDKVPAMALSKAKPAARPTNRTAPVKTESSVGPIRRPKISSTTSAPAGNNALNRTQEPLHPIQPTMKPTNGPQRVIRSTTTVTVPRSRGPCRSTSSSTGQLPVKKLPSSDTLRVNTASRDLTRPTLSQLARVKPPVVVARPLSKSVSGLNVRKMKSSTDLAANSNTRGHTLRVVKSRNERVDGTSLKRPRTPTSIPLPPSPALTSSVNLPHVEVNLSDGTASHEPTHSGNSGTPIAGDRIPGADMACKTPISTLLSSIQQGFDLTPCSPLSPPEHYVSTVDSAYQTSEFRLGVISG